MRQGRRQRDAGSGTSSGSGGIGTASAASMTVGFPPRADGGEDIAGGASTAVGIARIVIVRDGPAATPVSAAGRIDMLRRRARSRSRRSGMPGYASTGTSRLGRPTRLPSPKYVNISMADDSAEARVVRATTTMTFPNLTGAKRGMRDFRRGGIASCPWTKLHRALVHLADRWRSLCLPWSATAALCSARDASRNSSADGRASRQSVGPILPMPQNHQSRLRRWACGPSTQAP